MTGKNSQTVKDEPSPQAEVNPADVYGTFPRGSASNTDDVVAQLGRIAPLELKLVDIYDSEAVLDPAYQAKSHTISCAIQQIGMGRYQVRCPYRVWRSPSAFC